MSPHIERILEPELMTDDAQARAYAEADFEGAHSRYPLLFAETFPHRPPTALALDLGCGPADVTLRFARANPGYTIHGVDGSAAMLKYGREAVARANLQERITLIEGFIPDAPLPARRYDVILATSFLHQLHNPAALWETVRRYAGPGALVFVVDLFRPASRAEARALVEKYSGAEPEVLKTDFYNSLLAAFTPDEIRAQLAQAGLGPCVVKTVSDRHLIVYGEMTGL